VTLVSGPVAIADPAGVLCVHVETAEQMLAACRAALPADVAVCAAAVADWRVAQVAGQKLKKQPDADPPPLALIANPDILATLAAAGPSRPRLVVGFAAETSALLEHAEAKRRRKGCDWIVANDVGGPGRVMGGTENEVTLLSDAGVEHWPRAAKEEVARRLARRIAEALT
jgi:phosphopantothenoylcysteine decarboxylase/phosphopantothenate--cysteine ligase